MMLENTTALTDKLHMIDREGSNNLATALNNNPKTRIRTSTALVNSMEQIMSIIEKGRKTTREGTTAERSKSSIRELKKHSTNFSSSKGKTGVLLDLILRICIITTTELIENGLQTKRECGKKKKSIGKV
jgi:hypothetical protein